MNTVENKTMVALDNLTDWNVFGAGEIGYRDFKNVLRACKGDKYERDMLMLCSLQLGIIYGIKMERARRNRTAITPLDDGEN